MNDALDRRRFLTRAAALAALPAIASVSAARAASKIVREPGTRLKLALNAYSFDKPLKAGSMTLEDAVRFCASVGLDAIDCTGYYFPGYPKTPSSEAVYSLKRTAHVNGVAISGTGVRNDFTLADPAARRVEVQLVKDWIEVAERLGAPVIRVFAGPRAPSGYTFDQVLEWMVPAFRECAEYGSRHGVIVGLQHHNDFLKTAAETIRVIEAVGSPWFGNILDIGSLRVHDVYEEVARLIPYAVNWQLKETVFFGDKETPVDLKKLKSVIDEHGYRGYMPIETLGGGDARVRIAAFVGRIRQEFRLG